ncbi:MAG: hypothetical protein HYZ73_02525 [Elusimicrobia bacterium]|nr:hypothetical protein [Elusimicrobiota bacterium]
MIIESVSEVLDIKQGIFERLGVLLKEWPEKDLPILATTTSSLSVTTLARNLPERLRRRVIGFHPFNPPDRNDLVEIVQTEWTDPKILKDAIAFAKSLGFQPIVVKDSVGFIVNRILFTYLNEVMRVLETGEASFEQIVRAMRQFGMPLDPFRLLDFVGLDTSFTIIGSLQTALNTYFPKPSRFLEELNRRERFGLKTRKGIYTYQQRTPLPQERAKALARELSETMHQEVSPADVNRVYQFGLEPDVESLTLLSQLEPDNATQERFLALIKDPKDSGIGVDKELLQMFLERGIRLTGNVVGFDPIGLPLVMVNEAARIVEEGVASVADVDLAMGLGTLFPVAQGAGVRLADGIFAVTQSGAWEKLQAFHKQSSDPTTMQRLLTSGPFGWVLRYGIEWAVDELEAFAQRHEGGPLYEPAKLLRELRYGQLPDLRSSTPVSYKRAMVTPRGVHGPLEEGIVPTQQSLGPQQIRARILVADFRAVGDSPLLTQYHKKTGTVLGSAGIAMVTEVGKEIATVGGVQPGDIGVMLSGKHEVLTTEALGGNPQAYRGFRIHGYEPTTDALEGSYSQEVILDWSQFVKVDEGAYPFEDLGGVGWVYPTVEHTLNVGGVKKGDIVGVEWDRRGAIAGPAVQTAKFRDATVISIVSSLEDEKRAFTAFGTDGIVDRAKHPSEEAYVTALKETVKRVTGKKRPLDKVLVHSGQGSFGSHVLSVREANLPSAWDEKNRSQGEDLGGEVIYFGAGETGFSLEAPGTTGDVPIDWMLERIANVRRVRYRVPRLRRVLIVGEANGELKESIEAAKNRHSDVIVVVRTDEEGSKVKEWGVNGVRDGVINLQTLKIPIQRMPDPPQLLSDHPTAEQVEEFNRRQEAYTKYEKATLIPFGEAIGAIWGKDTTGRPISPDVDIVLLNGQDGANILNYLMFTGYFTQIGYPNDTSKMTLRWHAALGWRNQNSLVLTTKAILGSRYASPEEAAGVIDWLMRGAIRPQKTNWFLPPDLGKAQGSREEGKNVVLVGVRRSGLKTLAEAYRAQEIDPRLEQLVSEKPRVRALGLEGLYKQGEILKGALLQHWQNVGRSFLFDLPVPTIAVGITQPRFDALRPQGSGGRLLQFIDPNPDVIKTRASYARQKLLADHGEGIHQLTIGVDVTRVTKILRSQPQASFLRLLTHDELQEAELAFEAVRASPSLGRLLYNDPVRSEDGKLLMNYVLVRVPHPEGDEVELLVKLVQPNPGTAGPSVRGSWASFHTPFERHGRGPWPISQRRTPFSHRSHGVLLLTPLSLVAGGPLQWMGMYVALGIALILLSSDRKSRTEIIHSDLTPPTDPAASELHNRALPYVTTNDAEYLAELSKVIEALQEQANRIIPKGVEAKICAVNLTQKAIRKQL